jgi:dienelactone hydrolase
VRARRALCSAGVALAVVAGGCGSGDGSDRRPSVPPVTALAEVPGVDACPRAPAGLRIARIPFSGEALKAAVLGPGTTAVVFANEGGTGPCPWLPLARGLARRGARSVVFEYGQGTPEAEVAAAARWARREGARRVALVGAGRGARAVVIAAARHPELVATVVTLSAEQLQNGRDDLVPTVRRLRRPVLWVGSRDDNLTSWGRDTRTLSRATRSRHELILVPEGHGLELLAGARARRVVPALERFVLGE